MIKLFFDILHGINVSGISYAVALEFVIFLGYDGQLEQNSDLEIELFTSAIQQLKKTKLTKIENALAWLYVKSWENFGLHVLGEEELWNFGVEDLESAFTEVFYQRKKDENQRTKELKDLIMARFNHSKSAFFDWSQAIHNQVLTYCNKFDLKSYLIYKFIEDTTNIEANKLQSEFSKTKKVIDDESVIAFRASYASCLDVYEPSKIFWNDILYNHGECFDGTVFKAPIKGIYSFYATLIHDSGDDGYLCLGLNELAGFAQSKWSKRNKFNGAEASVSVTATFELEEGDEVAVFVMGPVHDFQDHSTVYFEGKLLSKLD